VYPGWCSRVYTRVGVLPTYHGGYPSYLYHAGYSSYLYHAGYVRPCATWWVCTSLCYMVGIPPWVYLGVLKPTHFEQKSHKTHYNPVGREAVLLARVPDTHPMSYSPVSHFWQEVEV